MHIFLDGLGFLQTQGAAKGRTLLPALRKGFDQNALAKGVKARQDRLRVNKEFQTDWTLDTFFLVGGGVGNVGLLFHR